MIIIYYDVIKKEFISAAISTDQHTHLEKYGSLAMYCRGHPNGSLIIKEQNLLKIPYEFSEGVSLRSIYLKILNADSDYHNRHFSKIKAQLESHRNLDDVALDYPEYFI